MGTINYPTPSDLDDGQTPSADTLNARIHGKSASPSSPAGANGGLDMDNLVAGFRFSRRHLQGGALSRGDQVGATANFDYLGDTLYPAYRPGNLFTFDHSSYEDSSVEIDGIDEVQYITVPGMSDVLTCTYDDASLLELTWRVSFFLGTATNTGADLEEDGEARWTGSTLTTGVDPYDVSGSRASVPELPCGLFRLFINGAPHPFILRRFRGAHSAGVPSSDYVDSAAQNAAGYPDFQVWEFTALFNASMVDSEHWPDLPRNPLQRGKHTASIRMFAANRIVRCKVRGFEWTYHR